MRQNVCSDVAETLAGMSPFKRLCTLLAICNTYGRILLTLAYHLEALWIILLVTVFEIRLFVKDTTTPIRVSPRQKKIIKKGGKWILIFT